MLNWFKKDPLKRIGAAVIALIALYIFIKFLGFISGFLFKSLFLLAIGLAVYVGFKKLTSKFSSEETKELPSATQVRKKKVSNKA